MKAIIFGWMITFLTVGLLFLFSSQTVLAWTTINGVAVCTAVTDQESPAITSDGAGGSLITWYDYRDTTYDENQGLNIYAQHIDSNGNPLWQVNGVAICTALTDQYSPLIVSDGAGGAIIVWGDDRNSSAADIYAQRVDSNGSTLWTNNGIAVCTAVHNQTEIVITTDGAGGAIMTWQDFRISTTRWIYAQRVSSSGSTMWTNNGVAICTSTKFQEAPVIVSDSAGGAIVVWSNEHNNGINDDIYAQRVNSNGSTLWANNGIPISAATGNQAYPVITSDGGGGVIIAWEDDRNSSNLTDIYAQRVNSSGSTLWTLDGVAVCTASNYQYYISIAGDGSHGAIMTWQDFRIDGSTTDVYAQRINSIGSTLWGLNGVAVCTAVNYQYNPQVAGDGTGGAIITWYDYHNEGDMGDIYAQRVNSSGSTMWTINGVTICTSNGDQEGPMIVSNGSNGAIITWFDYRNGDYDIYAQQINSLGLTPINKWWKY